MSSLTATTSSPSEKLAAVLERELADLPPLPQVAARLLDLLGNTESSVAELSRLLSMDPGAATKVLRLVNSSYYGFPRQVTTIGHAVVILGFSTVRNLVLAIAAFDRFTPARNAPLAADAFWEHAVAVAICSQILARRKRLPARVAEEAFLAGLLHDIGKLFLCQHFPDAYRRAIETAWRQKVRIGVTEQTCCGASHTLIGRRIADRWSLPPALVTTIWRHHDIADSDGYFEMVALVSASDAIARSSKIGLVGDPVPPALAPEVTKWLGADARMLREVQEELRARVEDAREFLQVALGH